MQEEEVPKTLHPPSPGFRDVNPLAAGVLKRNGIKSWTKPAPSLYPHQWSWDSAFIALGLAHVDNRKATDELEALFSAQWKTGKVPHIVFDPEAPPKSYFPDAERWNPNGPSDPAPAAPCTRGPRTRRHPAGGGPRARARGGAPRAASASRRCTRWRCAGSGRPPRARTNAAWRTPAGSCGGTTRASSPGIATSPPT